MDSSLWSKEILICNTVSQQSSLLGKIMQNNTEILKMETSKHVAKDPMPESTLFSYLLKNIKFPFQMVDILLHIFTLFLWEICNVK